MIVLDGPATARAATISQCADAIERALTEGFDAGSDPARQSLELPAGELLVMPSRATGVPSVKLVSVVPAGGVPPRVKGVHVVFDAESLAPAAVLDAAALTVSRTAAISLVAMRRLVVPDARRAVVFGSGPQAAAHVEALAAERPIRTLGIVGRTPAGVDRFAENIRADHPHLDVTVLNAAHVHAAVEAADVVVCATTSSVPVFETLAVGSDSTFVAIGAHVPMARELPGLLVARSFVVVEDRETALREAGDIAMPVAEGLLLEESPVDLTELVQGDVPIPPGVPRVFKSVGMAWEDAVVGAEIVRRVAAPV